MLYHYVSQYSVLHYLAERRRADLSGAPLLLRLLAGDPPALDAGAWASRSCLGGVCLSIYLSIYRSIYLSIYLYTYIYIYIYVFMYLCISLSLSLPLSISPLSHAKDTVMSPLRGQPDGGGRKLEGCLPTAWARNKQERQ